MDNRIIAKIYDQAGSYLGYFEDFVFSSFSSVINGGYSSLRITTAEKFDDYDTTVFALNNDVKIYLVNNLNPSGKLIYNGFITQIDKKVQEKESLELTVYPYSMALARDVVKSGTTINIKYSATEIKTIMEDLIDKYRTVNTSTKVDYSVSSIGTTSRNLTIEFDSSTYMEAINELKNSANYNWYYYFDANNILNFTSYSATPDVYFMFKREIASISQNSNLSEMTNSVLFWNGLQLEDANYISKLYEDATSITAYGRYLERSRDGRFTTTSGTDAFCNRIINTFKDPIQSSKIRIIDSNANPIDTIRVGQVCAIRNIEDDLGNLLITGIDYNYDYIDLDVTDVQRYLDRSIYQLENKVNDRSYADSGPLTYTT